MVEFFKQRSQTVFVEVKTYLSRQMNQGFQSQVFVEYGCLRQVKSERSWINSLLLSDKESERASSPWACANPDLARRVHVGSTN